MASLTQVGQITDPELRAKAAAKLLRRREEAHAAEQAAIREVRDAAVKQMLDAGRRPADAARAIGVTRSAITNRFGATGR